MACVMYKNYVQIDDKGDYKTKNLSTSERKPKNKNRDLELDQDFFDVTPEAEPLGNGFPTQGVALRGFLRQRKDTPHPRRQRLQNMDPIKN